MGDAPHDIQVSGPRYWWAGHLDVEGLALDSVLSLLATAEDLGAARGLPRRLGTTSAAIAAAFRSTENLLVRGEPVPAFAPLSGFFATSDGWVRTHGNYPHHARALREALGVPAGEREAVAAALTSLTSAEATERIRAAGAPCAPVLSPEAWRAHPAVGTPQPAFTRREGHAPHSGSLRRSPWRPAHAELPLEGVRVLSLTRVVAGPVAARALGALGAEVVRIDPPHMPELIGQHLDTDAGVHVETRELRGAADLDDLLADADVLLTGYRPRALARFGLDPEAVRARYPDVAHVWLQAWDPAGAWAEERGFDSLVQAASGIAVAYGEDGTPGALPAQALDHSTGYRMAAAACRQLARAERGADGFTLADAAWELLHRPHPAADAATTLEVPTREAETGYGAIRYVPPPFTQDGVPLDYRAAPE